jgi:acyl-CoA thioesterase FadM
MLGYLARTAPLIVRAALGRDGRTVSRIHRRVHPRQIDLNWHMNQAAYAEVMELGRTDWILRSNGWARWRDEGVHPVVAEQRIVYRRELKPLQRYTIDTRAVAIDGRLLVVQSHLIVGDRVHARNDTRLIFIGPDGVLAPDAVPPLCEALLTEALPVVDWRVE